MDYTTIFLWHPLLGNFTSVPEEGWTLENF